MISPYLCISPPLSHLPSMNNYYIIITVTICADETQGLITCDLYTWNKRRLKRNSVARRTMPNSNVKHVYGSINDCQRNIFSVRYTRLCDYHYYYCLFFLFYGSILFWFFFFSWMSVVFVF